MDRVDEVFERIKKIQQEELNGGVIDESGEAWYKAMYTTCGKGECKTPGCPQRFYGSGPYCYACAKYESGLMDRTIYYESE